MAPCLPGPVHRRTDVQDVAELLGPHGPLVEAIDGFQCREAQQQMAGAIAECLTDNDILVVEAGTGIGKTFAYLVPALLSGGKVIVSTGTRNLQDQLYHRDLPVVRDALGLPLRTALLKGRANYLCRYRLHNTISQGRLRSRELVDELQEVRSWAGRTRSGDIAEVTALSEQSAIWPLVTSTADNCLGNECPDYGECHVMLARRKAQEADIVVINHHLLFADLALKEDGFGELLPSANAFIIDEAHQLPDIATGFFGLALGARQLNDLARDVQTEHLREGGDMAALPDARQALEKAVADLRIAMDSPPGRYGWNEVIRKNGVESALQELADSLAAMTPWLEKAAVRGKGLESCWRRCLLLQERLQQLRDDTQDDHIRWVEIFRSAFSLHLTPLQIAESFQAGMAQQNAAWVFTSATLAVGDDFGHFTERLGLEDARCLQLDSPFDYPRHAVLYVPRDLPEPNTPDYTRAVIDASLPVLEASGGRAFLLFTSHRALREAAELLHTRIEHPLLVQGDAPRGVLLERFREYGNAVLLGTSSFWEGVDVRGEALSCVVIDRLPFASPGDPVLRARIEHMREQGGNPFMDYQLPNAVITLKQGVGRLIRDVEDRGIMMLCDPRLLSKPYGRVFLDSLPPMTRTRELDVVRRFFRIAGHHEAMSATEQEACD